jgi:hypothetical protein
VVPIFGLKTNHLATLQVPFAIYFLNSGSYQPCVFGQKCALVDPQNDLCKRKSFFYSPSFLDSFAACVLPIAIKLSFFRSLQNVVAG